MRRFATFFKGFAKGFFKIAKVIRKMPNEFRTSNRNASRSLAVIIHEASTKKINTVENVWTTEEEIT